MAIDCRGVKKHGGQVKLNAHVDKILLEGKRASGVLLKDGSVVKARKVPLCKFSKCSPALLSTCMTPACLCLYLEASGWHITVLA